MHQGQSRNYRGYRRWCKTMGSRKQHSMQSSPCKHGKKCTFMRNGICRYDHTLSQYCPNYPKYKERKQCFHGKLCGIPGCAFRHEKDERLIHHGIFSSYYYSYPEVPRAGRILEILRRMATKQREYRAEKTKPVTSP